MLQGRNLYVKSYCCGRFVLRPRGIPYGWKMGWFGGKPYFIESQYISQSHLNVATGMRLASQLWGSLSTSG